MKVILLRDGSRISDGDRFQASPARAVYSLKKDPQTNRFLFIVPIDVWLLKAIRGGSGGEKLRNSAFFSRPLDSLKIASPGSTQGFATPLGNPPSVLIPGVISPFIKCLGSPEFRVSTRKEKEIAEISDRDILPKSEVSTDLPLSTTRGNAIVTHTDVAFSYNFLGLPVEVANTYQIELTGRASDKIIGSPVETNPKDGRPPKLLGMLIGLEKRPNNRYKGWVFPAEDINEL